MTPPDLRELERRLRGYVARLAKQRRTERAVESAAATHRSQLQRLERQLERQQREVERLTQRLGRMRGGVRKQAAYFERLARWIPPTIREKGRLAEQLRRLTTHDRPIIVGPWTGEVGYEVLYWAPFVRWFVEQFEIDPARLHVVSRGGPQSWYGGLARNYADALTYLSADEFRDRADARGWMKQDRVTGFDRRIVQHARTVLDCHRPALLHPGFMFRLFKPFWGDRMTMNDVLASTSHRLLEPPPPVPGLPARYVAVRFYFRSSFPDTPQNRALAARTITALAAEIDVVVLNPGVRVDDHHDYVPEGNSRIHTIDQLLTPDRNLEIQTAVIARADALVGSYGGFSYLAPLLGVDAVAFYSEQTFKTCHLQLAEAVFERLNGGSLRTLDTRDLDLLGKVLAPEKRVRVS
jgi:hypothetical protein